MFWMDRLAGAEISGADRRLRAQNLIRHGPSVWVFPISGERCRLSLLINGFETRCAALRVKDTLG